MAAPPAPLPPEIAEQASPQGAQSAFMAEGIGHPQPGMQAVQSIVMEAQKIAQSVDSIRTQLQQLHPPLIANLAPIEVALKQMLMGLNKVAQRSGMAQGSPVIQSPPQGAGVPGSGPPNPMGQ